MIRRKQTILLLDILEMKQLKQVNTIRALIAIMKESMRLNELSFTFQLWNQYKFVLTRDHSIEKVLKIIVGNFVKSAQYIEVKTYLVMEVFDHMEYKHVDEILTSMEEHFGEVEEDGSNSYLLCNLNPVKTAMHMLMLLSNFEERYSMAVLRTQELSEVIL